MHKTEVHVTVNSGDDKGNTGLLVGYDRNKYCEVLFDNKELKEYKGYYLDGIEKLQGHQKYLLQYPKDYFSHRGLTNKELANDLRLHTNKGKGLHKRFRYFSIDVHGNHGGEYYDDLTLQALKKVVRSALHRGCSFDVRISPERKGWSSSEGLLEFDYEGNVLYTFKTSEKNERYLGTFTRSISKEIDKYY